MTSNIKKKKEKKNRKILWILSIIEKNDASTIFIYENWYINIFIIGLFFIINYS